MQVKTIPIFIAIAILLACQQKNYGLNPLSDHTDSFAVVHKVTNHLENAKRDQTVKLNFSLRSLHTDDSSNTFLFTITGFQLDPAPPFMQQVANFDSLQSVLACSPYEVTVDKLGNVTNVKGEEDLQNNTFTVFTNRYIAKSFTEDYLGANAVEDILNRFFAVVPHKGIKAGDNWVKDITLITKAPVKVSNLFSYERISGDSVFIQNKSLISADQGDASSVYMKGDQVGKVVISAETGMPYLYNTQATMVTTTVAGGRTTEEVFEIRRLN